MSVRRSSRHKRAAVVEEVSEEEDVLMPVDAPADETDLALGDLDLDAEDDSEADEDDDEAEDEGDDDEADFEEKEEAAESTTVQAEQDDDEEVESEEEVIEGLEEEPSTSEDDEYDEDEDDEDEDEDEEEEEEASRSSNKNNSKKTQQRAAGSSSSTSTTNSTKPTTSTAAATQPVKKGMRMSRIKLDPIQIKTKLRTLESLPTFLEVDVDQEYYRKAANPPSPPPQKESWMTQGNNQMTVNSSSSDTEDDMHSRDQIGKIPTHWYDNEDHIGYDLDGKKVKKSGKAKDRLDKFLDKVDDPNYGRTIVDPMTKKEIVLSQEEVDMIKRIQGGEFPDGNMDPYEDYVHWYTSTPFIHPISNKPEPKSRFVPSKWEHKQVMKYVRAIRKGWLKPKVKVEEPEFYDIWGQQEELKGRRKAPPPITAPKLPLPGNAHSYNPPAEYVPDEEERKEWEEMDPEDRPRNFLPEKFASLRHVPAYNQFIQERFARCLDLYLCPRTVKQRINIDPESLIPKLPKPSELKPFPSKQSLCYEGHAARVSCISVDPSGRWLLSGSDDGKAIFWEVTTGRKQLEIAMPKKAEVRCVAWNPNPAITVAAITFDKTVWLVNPQLGSTMAYNATDKMLHQQVPVDPTKKSKVEWARATKGEYKVGIRFVVQQSKPIDSFKWHNKGNYFSTVAPSGVSDSVAIHSLLRHTSQHPFKKGRDVQTVAFHPSKPIFFVATKTHIRVYNLHTQALIKKLTTGSQHISSIDVHPKGDNLILGSYDRRLCWFDLDLSVKPYKTLRYHRLAIRAVSYHNRQPLFASASDDGTIHVFHGMVYSDLMQNPLIVPVKILRGHAREDKTGLGVMDCCFHPTQPWLFSAGADGTIRLYTDE